MNLARPSLKFVAGDVLAGWRGLGRFWAGVLLLIGLVGGTLGMLPPPVAPVVKVSSLQPPPNPVQPKSSGPTMDDGLEGQTIERSVTGSGRGGDPALLEVYPGGEGLTLPRIGADGRKPMTVYAAPFDRSAGRPRISVVVGGIGMSRSDSIAAAKSLPHAVTLAISPYAADLDPLLQIVRDSGHEYLMSIPMEPEAFPSNDPDDRRALMTSQTPEANITRLRWVLARANGFVGVTGAMGPMLGTRLLSVADQLGPVLEEIGQRGLLFVDSRIDRPPLPGAWSRSVDVMIDDDALDATALDIRLDELTRRALSNGSALGLVSIPRPTTLARLVLWASTLRAKGLDLAPVSALVVAPPS